MGLAGQIGAGASTALDDVIVQVLAKKKFDEQIRAQQAQEAAQQQQIGLAERRLQQDATQHDDVMGFNLEQFTAQRDRADAAARAAADREAFQSTARANMSELIDNPQQLAAFSLASGVDVPAGVRELTKPKEKKYHKVTGIGPRGGPVSRLVPEDSPEWSQGIPEYREPRSGGSVDYEWVTGADGQPRQIPKGTARPGDRPYDKAGTGNALNQADAAETAAAIERLGSEMLKSPGFGRAFGVLDSRLPTVRQSTADVEEMTQALQGLLTLENTGKLKGVLSNADMEILRRASTVLGGRLGDERARAEVQRLVGVAQKAKKALGTPGPAPGTERVINGVPAVWDGTGWMPK